MVRERIIETTEGIQSEITVGQYDRMLRGLRDKGWMETEQIIKSGISSGHALEIGPGPGYLGLEWLSRTTGTQLTGIEISQAMIAQAYANAREYQLADRVQYQVGNAQSLPFGDASFDCVFTNGSLHEWEHPDQVIKEMFRVLKPAGKYWISDLKRNMAWPVRMFLKLNTRPREIKSGLISSINAAYTVSEIQGILEKSKLNGYTITANPIGLVVQGSKQPEK